MQNSNLTRMAGMVKISAHHHILFRQIIMTLKSLSPLMKTLNSLALVTSTTGAITLN